MKTIISVSHIWLHLLIHLLNENNNIDLKPLKNAENKLLKLAEMRTDLSESMSELGLTPSLRLSRIILSSSTKSSKFKDGGDTDGGRRGYSGGVTEIPSTPQSILESLML